MRPKILEFAIVRIEATESILCQYDYELSLNTVTFDGKKEPFVGSSNLKLSTATKTRVRNEQDDHSSDLEMATKTKIQREADDYALSNLALTTKTFVKNERDD